MIKVSKLNVYNIFNSIDGEVNGFSGAGELTTFVRLRGCNLKCAYCDTQYAQNKDPITNISVDRIIDQCNLRKVTITGGEPLLQRESLLQLILHLIKKYKKITLETNGTLLLFHPEQFGNVFSLSRSLQLIRYVVDYKLPSSIHNREEPFSFAFHKDNWKLLQPFDTVKFVICTEEDYVEACNVMEERSGKCKFALSPVFTKNNEMLKSVRPSLVRRMIHDAEKLSKWNCSYSLQIHKLLNVP